MRSVVPFEEAKQSPNAYGAQVLRRDVDPLVSIGLEHIP